MTAGPTRVRFLRDFTLRVPGHPGRARYRAGQIGLLGAELAAKVLAAGIAEVVPPGPVAEPETPTKARGRARRSAAP